MNTERITGLEIDLRRGPVNPVFKVSRLPDFRFLDDPFSLSPANLARYEMYLERLKMIGVNPLEQELRMVKGVMFKSRFRKSKFRAHEQASVQA